MKAFKLLDKHIYDQIVQQFGQKGGIYKIFCKTDTNVVSIDRILGKDIEGILYIGKANNFLNRIINLKKTLSDKSENHIFGRRYNKLIKIKEKFNKENLYISLVEAENPKEKEMEELENYRNKFGENPPLNRLDY